MRKVIYKIGRIRIVILLSVIAVLLAVGLNYIFQLFQEDSFSYSSLFRAAVIPVIVAPLLSWYLVGLFLRVIKLEKKMSEWALFDQLTGLLNRRAFLHRAEQEYRTAKRYKTTFGIVVLDLDHFKNINDQHGHKAGDAILKDFGDLVLEQIRQSDISGRIGGEEFAFILPNTNLAQSQVFAEKLLKAVADRQVIIDGQTINYTASIGITVSFPENDFKIHNLIHHADQALYKAKSAGRNCYKVAENLL